MEKEKEEMIRGLVTALTILAVLLAFFLGWFTGRWCFKDSFSIYGSFQHAGNIYKVERMP